MAVQRIQEYKGDLEKTRSDRHLNQICQKEGEQNFHFRYHLVYFILSMPKEGKRAAM